MSPAVVLFLLRLLSALLLLTFLGLIAWLINRDIRLQTTSEERASTILGKLRVVESPEESLREQVFPLYSETWIGRSSSNGLMLDDAYTSNRHAVLRKRGRQWWLEDLESRNGTLLNEIPLTAPAVVTSGDQFTIGRTSFVIELGVSE
jgi:pSer/pThr/pTyr-binding forkhead associated (FHA) protein